jgi:hypothetical protein
LAITLLAQRFDDLEDLILKASLGTIRDFGEL